MTAASSSSATSTIPCHVIDATVPRGSASKPARRARAAPASVQRSASALFRSSKALPGTSEEVAAMPSANVIGGATVSTTAGRGPRSAAAESTARSASLEPSKQIRTCESSGCVTAAASSHASSSAGANGDAVRQPTYRDAKARTLLETAVQVLGPSAPAAGLELVDDRGRAHRDPAVVLVSNNPHAFDPPHAPGTRPALDSGQLGVVVLDRRAPGQTSARTWTAKQLEVITNAPVHAGIDGEAIDLSSLLRFAIRPRALRVRLPRP
jgi:hypothetical protein